MNEVNIYKKKLWKFGKLPNKTAIFVIGDIHGEYLLLNKIMREINKEIEKLSKLVKKEIIFIGDYIDRGVNSKKTISNLLSFKKHYSKIKNINIHFICGNHDEFFSKLIFSNGINPDPNNKIFKQDPLKKLLKSSLNYIYIAGFKAWYYIGGGKTTIKDYCPSISKTLDDLLKNIEITPTNYIKLNLLISELRNNIPEDHKSFFKNVIKTYYIIIGNYLFIHAGIDPKKTLKDQGIGKNSLRLNEYQFVELLMIRDRFLWVDNLNKCPFYVVHGHTPSEKIKYNMVIADGNKNYRLCLDTKVYDEKGSLTCFFKFKESNKFISVSKKNSNVRVIY